MYICINLCNRTHSALGNKHDSPSQQHTAPRDHDIQSQRPHLIMYIYVYHIYIHYTFICNVQARLAFAATYSDTRP